MLRQVRPVQAPERQRVRRFVVSCSFALSEAVQAALEIQAAGFVDLRALALAGLCGDVDAALSAPFSPWHALSLRHLHAALVVKKTKSAGADRYLSSWV